MPSKKPGFYRDTDGDYWLKTQEGVWLYSDMLCGDQFIFATTVNVTWNPEEIDMCRIDPSQIDCAFTSKEFQDYDEWLEQEADDDE